MEFKRNIECERHFGSAELHKAASRMAKAIIEKLPFPLKALTWERLPEVAMATDFDFAATYDLMKLVLGDPPEGLASWY